jgi:glycosyltransferase involved in cell wall biosynthesis
MHVCILYDCLFPWTVGGGEKWYRQMAEAHAAVGNTVTYLTLRQWDKDDPPVIPGVQIVAVGPRLKLYADGKRRILPPLVYGLGVFLHLLLHGRRYDLLHGASFPFFSILAAGALRPFLRFRIAVDWFEVWTDDYWRAYLGRLGAIGIAVQKLCARVPQIGFSLSRLHLERARALGVADITLLEGTFCESEEPPREPWSDPPEVLYAGRLIPEKRVLLLIDALADLMRDDKSLRATLIGKGPDEAEIVRRINHHGLEERIGLLGFVGLETLHAAQSRAAVLVQPSEREGYGLVVVESASRGVPVVVVPGSDNASVELLEPGENGFMASSPTAEALARAIREALDGRDELRRKTSAWYEKNRGRLSFVRSFETILERLTVSD